VEPDIIPLSSFDNRKVARIVSFDSPFVLRLSKDERRLRTGFGNVLRFKMFA
jgi:hypothetical protein